MTYTFIVQIDIEKGGPRKGFALARAVYRVLTHACEVDIKGAEVLNCDIGQISVTVQP